MELLRKFLMGILATVVAGAFFILGMIAATMVGEKPAATLAEVESASHASARNSVEAALASRFFGQHREALQHLEEARRWDPALRGLDYQFALTYLDLGEYGQSEDKVQRSLRKNEEISNAYALSAMIALAKARAHGSSAEARDSVMKNVQAARVTDPLNPMPHYVLAEFYRSTGHPDLAVTAYRRALERVSKSDSILMTTVKAGLAGLRSNHHLTDPPLEPVMKNGAASPEQFFFAAADALLRNDQERAMAYLKQVRQQVSEDDFEYLVGDPFFQDYLVSHAFLDENGKSSK